MVRLLLVVDEDVKDAVEELVYGGNLTVKEVLDEDDPSSCGILLAIEESEVDTGLGCEEVTYLAAVQL